MKKKCGTCKKHLSVDCFHKRGSHFQSVCKICRKTSDKVRYATHYKKKLGNDRYREKINNFVNSHKKNKGCVNCGNTNPTVLDFHHATGDKSFNIGERQKWGFPAIKDEMLKCIVICSNCHRMLHAGEIHLNDAV